MNGCHSGQLKVAYYTCRPNSDNTSIQPTAGQTTKYLPCEKIKEDLIVGIITHSFE